MPLRDITLGRYIHGQSTIHRLDPRTKLVCVLAISITAFASDSGLLPAACLAVVAFVAAGLRLATFAATLRPFCWLLAFTFAVHAAMGQGEHFLLYVPFFDLTVTREGIIVGLLMGLRLTIAITLASLLTLTTTPSKLTDALERMLRPLRRFGFPNQEFAMMVTISIRFIPVLMDEAERLRRAQVSRGADFSGGPLQRARKLVPLVVPLFLSAFDRADRLSLAMESRAYGCGTERTTYRRLSFGQLDLATLLATAACLLSSPTLSLLSHQ